VSLSSIHSSRITDLIVLVASFMSFSFLTEIQDIKILAFECLLYVSVVFISLRISKRLIFQYLHGSTRVISILVGNSVGLLTGGLAVALISKMFSGSNEAFAIILFSSILAFFILGTFSPMIKSSHRDIIRH